jgi:hypothetical protein
MTDKTIKFSIKDENEAEKNIPSDNNSDALTTQTSDENRENSQTEISSEDKNMMEFEELTKGPYKDAFTKKVQSIINKRFKEQKVAQNKEVAENKTGETNETTQNAEKAESLTNNTSTDSTFNSLIDAGVDPETAYRVLHLDEIMDSSMRYGAELAAKQIADSIRQKSARPFESALSQKGYSAKATASSLTPEKRKELAKKALMGEHIGF